MNLLIKLLSLNIYINIDIFRYYKLREFTVIILKATKLHN